jgi:L-asparaginase II
MIPPQPRRDDVVAKLTEITRGEQIEAVHEGSVAVVDGTGKLLAWAGDPQSHRFFRSSAKPFQATPLVVSGAADAFGFTTEELALSCASHNATERHQAIVTSMLEKIGLGEEHLQCGFTEPLDEEEAARLTLGLKEQNQIQCECSGEHTGMLAACQHMGWPIDSYTDPDHPLQQQVRSIVAAACGVEDEALQLATDGCSIPTFGSSIQSFAFAFAVLADPTGARWRGASEWGEAVLRMRDAMVRHPDLISGGGEIDTTIMQQTEGRVVGKLGAEGLLCLAIPARGLGVAISDAGGSTRSLGPAAIAVMEQLELESPEVITSLRKELCPPIQSFAGKDIGETRPALELQH